MSSIKRTYFDIHITKACIHVLPLVHVSKKSKHGICSKEEKLTFVQKIKKVNKVQVQYYTP
ncbi:hypothetical protein Hanom_Chr04g00311711 [Helianthus anomalus]